MLRTKAVRRVWQMSRPVGTCILVCAIVAFRFIHLYAYMHVYIRHLTFYFSIYIYITLVLEVKIAESFKDSRCPLCPGRQAARARSSGSSGSGSCS